MARNYNSNGRRPEPVAHTPAWIWLLLGIVIGVLLSFFVYLSELKPMLDNRTTEIPIPPKAASVPPPTETAETRPPKFEFYDALADQREFRDRNSNITSDLEPALPEVPSLPSNDVDAQAILDTSPALEAIELPPGSFLLQVASFQDELAAEEMQARLALQGFSPSIRVARINGKLWHRVHVGPFYAQSAANEAGRLLRQSGFEPIVLKF